jgi:hypothetical protein
MHLLPIRKLGYATVNMLLTERSKLESSPHLLKCARGLPTDITNLTHWESPLFSTKVPAGRLPLTRTRGASG